MKYLNYITAVFIIALMFIIADVSGQKEIIFPEIAALVIGAILVEKQPWVVNKVRMWFVMTFCSIAGVSIVTYLDVPLIFQIAAGFSLTFLVLIISRTTMIPAVSACILPVLTNTQGWIYPVSVSLMTLSLTGIMYIMEKYGLRKRTCYVPIDFVFKENLIKYIKLFTGVILISLIAVYTGHLYIIAPPLIVTFIEFSDTESKIRQKPLMILSLVAFASIFEIVLCRIFININFLLLATIIGCIIMFIILEKLKFQFPPIGAIFLLPLLLDSKSLNWYPLETTIGASLFIICSLLLFKTHIKKPALEENFIVNSSK